MCNKKSFFGIIPGIYRKTIIILGILAVGILSSCDNTTNPDPAPVTGNPPTNYDMTSTYTFSINNQEHTWIFSANGNYEVTGYYIVGTKSGTWSSSGNDITISYASSGGGAISGNEIFTVQPNGEQVALTLKDNSAQLSLLLVSFGLATKTVTLTKKGDGEGGVDPSLPALTGWVYITGVFNDIGTPKVGHTLKADTNSLNGSGTISYQWIRGNTSNYNEGTDIPDAIGSTYTLVLADIDKYIKVTIKRTENSGSVTGVLNTTVRKADPFQWTNVANTTFNNNVNSDYNVILDIAWGNNIFVTVGTNGQIANSTDGVNWIKNSDSTFGTSQITRIIWGSGMFVATGDRGKIAYSYNGTTWNAVTNNPFQSSTSSSEGYGIVWANNKFIAGWLSDIAYSDTGVNWTKETNSVFTSDYNRVLCIAHGNGRFVAGGLGQIAYSNDGKTWIPVNTNASDFIRGIVWGGPSGQEKFVAVGAYGRGLYSYDGISWVSTAMNTSNGIQSVTWGNDMFVAVGGNGYVSYSMDGITWIPFDRNTFDSDNNFYNIAWANNRFIAVGLSYLRGTSGELIGSVGKMMYSK